MRWNVLRYRASLAAVLVAAAPALFGCATGQGPAKGQFNLISLQEEWALGRQLSRDLEHELEIVHDPEAVAYLDRMGQRLAAQTWLRDAPWEFHLVRDDAINAFNIPGGHVYVNTGLVHATDNAAELAGVLAHEISHGAARHATENLSKAYGWNLVASLLLGQNAPLYQQIVASIATTGVFMKFSRDAEREADEWGVRYMYDAGYDPYGMVTMFQELLAERERKPGALEQFFSSHPLTEERIQDVRAQIQQLPPKPNLLLNDAGFEDFKRRLGG